MISLEQLPLESLKIRVEENKIPLSFPFQYTLEKIEKIKKKLPKSYDNIARIVALSRPIVELVLFNCGIEDPEPDPNSRGRPGIPIATHLLVQLLSHTLLADSYRQFERVLNAHPLWLKALGLKKAPNHTTMSKFRTRMGVAFFDAYFHELTHVLFSFGLLTQGEKGIIDSAPIEACQNFARSNSDVKLNEHRLQSFFDSVDFTPALNLIAPADARGRKSTYSNEVLLKFLVFEKLCGFLSRSQALKHVKKHPSTAKILGFNGKEVPSDATLIYFLKRIPPLSWLMRIMVEPMTEFFDDHPDYEDNDAPLDFFFRSF